MAISKLSSVDTLAASDQIALYSEAMGGDARTPLSVLAAFVATLLTVPQAFESQYEAPSANGFTVAITPSSAGANVYLILTPAANYASGTIALPSASTAVDGQEVLCVCTASVTALTVSSSGALGVVGAPTTLAVNAFFRMRYDGAGRKWFRIG